jgi:hypothetical protein
MMDTEGPHEHAHAPHRTGFRWLDISLALSAAGKSRRLFSWPEAQNDPRWARLKALATKIDVRVCYCSVLEECYVHDSRRTEPERIQSCPVPAVPYADE